MNKKAWDLEGTPSKVRFLGQEHTRLLLTGLNLHVMFFFVQLSITFYPDSSSASYNRTDLPF